MSCLNLLAAVVVGLKTAVISVVMAATAVLLVAAGSGEVGSSSEIL